MNAKPKKFELADQTETDARRREIQLLLNIVEPDPDYQPFILTDEASLFSAVGSDEETLRRRLNFYFGDGVDLQLHLPMWKLVDDIKRQRPDWPEDAN
jgi:hypothetical protein